MLSVKQSDLSLGESHFYSLRESGHGGIESFGQAVGLDAPEDGLDGIELRAVGGQLVDGAVIQHYHEPSSLALPRQGGRLVVVRPRS